MKLAAWSGVAVLLVASAATAQTLRFDEYREHQVPEYANLRIGPFFSDISFSQSAGYRYSQTTGAGREYQSSNEYGRIVKDGSDYPLVTHLTLRNYMLISRYMDLNIALALAYSHYPMGTEANEVRVESVRPRTMMEAGASTTQEDVEMWYGGFYGRRGDTLIGEEQAGIVATISSDFQVTPFVRGRVYDIPSYRTDYVDQRGNVDEASGRKYTTLQNLLGLDADWLMAKDKNLAYSGSRLDTEPQEDEYAVQRSVIYKQELAYQQQLNPVAVGGGRAAATWRYYDEGRGDQYQEDFSVFLGADLSEDTTFNASLGYSTVELTGANGSEFNGTSDTVIGSLRLNSQLTERLAHGLGYEKSQDSGFEAGVNTIDSYNYSISWNRQDLMINLLTTYRVTEGKLGREGDYTDWINQVKVTKMVSDDLTLTLSTAYVFRDKKLDEADVPGEADDVLSNGNYDTWASTIGFGYVLAQHWTANAYVEHLEQISDVDELAFTREMAGISIKYQRDL